MKQSRQDVTLCEKDALQDMLNAEKQLMSLYAIAVTEGSGKAFRKELLGHYASCAEDQFSVFEQMLARGYYEAQPAEPQMIREKKDSFSKVLKQISAK